MPKAITLFKFIASRYIASTCKNKTLKLTRLYHSNDPTEFRPQGTSHELDEWHSRFACEEGEDGKEPVVLCLSPLISSVPMWGLYGESHKGAAVAIQLTILNTYRSVYRDEKHGIEEEYYCHELDDKNWLLKCRYTQQRIELKDIKELEKYGNTYAVGYFLRLIANKGVLWEHENEYRLLFPENHIKNQSQLLSSDFSNKFKGLVIGTRCRYKTAEVRKMYCNKISENPLICRAFSQKELFLMQCDYYSDSKLALDELEKNATSISWEELAEKLY